ncbi:MAG: hypothetical protein V1859_07330 [archaeon]
MKFINYVLFFVLLSTSVAAIRDMPFFSGDVISDEPFFIKGEEYRAVFIRYVNNTIIYYPNGVSDVLTQNRSCSGQWIYSTCVSNIRYSAKGRVVPEDVREANINITIHLTINSTNASIIFLQKYEKESFSAKEKVPVKISLINEGKIIAENLSFSIEYPGYFVVTNATGCTAELNSVFYKGTMLSENKGIECTYFIYSEKEAKVNVTAEYTYGFLDRQIKKTDTKFLNISISLNQNTSEVKENISDKKPEAKKAENNTQTAIAQDTSLILEQQDQNTQYEKLEKISPLIILAIAIMLLILLLFVKFKHNKYSELDKEIQEIKKKE